MRPNSANCKVSAPLQRYVGYVGESNGHGVEDGLTVEDSLTFDSDAFEVFGDGFEFDTTEDFGFKVLAMVTQQKVLRKFVMVMMTMV
jgi:hypothetical protein